MRLKDFVKETGGTMSDLFNLPLSALRRNPDNIRMDTQELRDHIRSLANSIKTTGYLRSRPLTVRFDGDAVQIVDGNCRFSACLLAVAEGAEIQTVPCVPEAVGTNDADRTANMLVANSGLAHQPLEIVTAIKKLLSFGWTDTKIAERLGKSRQYVTNLLDLASAPEDVQTQIRNGTISATQALRVVRTEGVRAGAVIASVAEKARAEGRTHVTPREFAAPAKPVKANGLADAVRDMIRVWDAGDVGPEFDAIIGTLRELVA
jgi:ParB family transcriptional regulator, chromosome partitioning protein